MLPPTRLLALVSILTLAGVLVVAPGAGAKTIKGSSKNDVLVGTKRADRIDGKGGNDKIRGNGGKDVLIGGKGKDKINAGTGDDTIKAKDGNVDTITCGPGKDVVIADAKDKLAADCEPPTLPVSPPGSLTVATSGDGSVSISPAGINCREMCSNPFSFGTILTLTATPDAHRTFSGWGRDCSGTTACTVTVGAGSYVTAAFAPDRHDLTVTLNGSGSGSVSSSPAGINCPSDCSESVTHGDKVTLTAAAQTGSTFAGWSGGGCSGTDPCEVTVTDATDVTAQFTINTYTLSVIKAGAGNGIVTSSPFGIACGIDCGEQYPYGTVVTLSASNDPGSVFAGWSGACSGIGSCFVMITSAATVSATFDPAG